MWLLQHGAPASHSGADAHFAHLAERVLWQEAKTMGLTT
jgi:hypothetical protein